MTSAVSLERDTAPDVESAIAVAMAAAAKVADARSRCERARREQYRYDNQQRIHAEFSAARTERDDALSALLDAIATDKSRAVAPLAARLKEAADLFIAIQTADGEDEHRAICAGVKLAKKIDADLIGAGGGE